MSPDASRTPGVIHAPQLRVSNHVTTREGAPEHRQRVSEPGLVAGKSDAEVIRLAEERAWYDEHARRGKSALHAVRIRDPDESRRARSRGVEDEHVVSRCERA